MSMAVGYKPYTGAINTNSARYKRAKAMYDEGHPNGEETKSAAEVKVEKDLQNLKMLKQMLGQKYDDLDLKFKNYADAIDQILENQDIVTLLSNGEIMTITVMGPNETQSAKIFSQVEACTAGHRNTYCHFSSSEEAAGANITGLSHGKYRAFLEIQSLDPGITPEEIQGMTMREIRDLMNELSAGNESETSPAGDKEHGRHRHGREKETQACIQ